MIKGLKFPLRKFKPFSISFHVCLLGLVGIICTLLFIFTSNKKVHVIQQKSIMLEKNESGCFLTMETPIRSDGQLNAWQQDDGRWGAEYDIYLHNGTKYIVEDYSIDMKVPAGTRIDSSWNGKFTESDGLIKIEPMEDALNTVLKPKDVKKFGFILYTDSLLHDAEFNMKCHLIINPLKSLTFLVFLGISILGLIAVIASCFSYYLLKKQEKKNDEQVGRLIKLCASFIDARDKYTRMHSYHVAEYSRMIAAQLGMSQEEQKFIYYNGMMHDVGKVLIPREILCKPGKLTDEEWLEMRRHTTYGAEIINDFNEIPNLRNAILYHHERYDGKGYMEGLKGEQIPLVARIICVADSYDAMATDRAYRPRLAKEEIIKQIENGKGSQFDPVIADAMLQIIESGKVQLIK